MMCVKCGADAGESKFCPECGAPMRLYGLDRETWQENRKLLPTICLIYPFHAVLQV